MKEKIILTSKKYTSWSNEMQWIMAKKEMVDLTSIYIKLHESFKLSKETSYYIRATQTYSQQAR